MITPIRDTHAPHILFSPCHMTPMLHAHIDNHHPPFDHIGHDHSMVVLDIQMIILGPTSTTLIRLRVFLVLV
jgi:hypothetical protein